MHLPALAFALWFARLAPMAEAATLAYQSDAEFEVVTVGEGGARLRFGGAQLVEVDTWLALVVELSPGAAPSPALRAAGRPLGGSERWWRVPVAEAGALLRAARVWAAEPGVALVTPDLVLEKRATTLAFDDPRYAGQWYHESLGTETLWVESLGDPAVRVAVIDSAVELAHPDLAAAFVAPLDAFDEDEDPSPNAGEFCGGGMGLCDEHGTAVAGIIGARANNAEGIVGFCPECTLIPIKMLGEGRGSLSADIAAFEHAIDNDAAVINNSWGFVESIPVPTTLANVIHRAATTPRGGLGALVVFAAGNDDRSLEDNELTGLPDVLCVSATDRYGNPTAYTNRGESVALAAPSATVTTSVRGGYTETFGGTSAAAPVVSGVAGWLLSVRPDLSAAEAREAFVGAAVPSPLVTADESGHHPVYGYGNLNLEALREAVLPSERRLGACGCQAAGGTRGGLGGLLVVVACATLRRRRGRVRANPT